MCDSLRGFGSKTLILVVGPEEKCLYVPRAILQEIPYFRSYFGATVPDDTTQIHMLQYKATTLADVIYFFWMQTVPELDSKSQITPAGPNNLEIKMKVIGYVEAYVTAERSGIHWLRRHIRRALVVYHQDAIVNPYSITVLSNSSLANSFLCKFLMAELGHNISFSGFNVLDKDSPGFEEACEHMPKAIMWNLLKAADVDGKRSTKPSKQGPWYSDDIAE